MPPRRASRSCRKRADLAQELQRVVRRAVVELALGARVVELLAGAHECAAHGDLDAFAGLVDLHVPDERGSRLVREQAARVLGDLRGVEAGFVVRRVQRLTPSCASVSIGPPGVTKAPTSAIA